jgi:hypothetical protein
MATNVSAYKGSILVGTGIMAEGSRTITSWTASTGQTALGRRLMFHVTGAGTHIGRNFTSRVTAEGATLTIVDPCPHVGA